VSGERWSGEGAKSGGELSLGAFLLVIPAKAGIQFLALAWVPEE
jgi:hypothetical protein